MITDQDMFGNYRAYLFTPPYPVPTPTSGTTQIVQGNPTSLGTTGLANSFAYDAVGNALYFTSNGSTWVSVSSGGTVNGMQGFFGNYAGSQPNVTPTAATAVGFDTSTGTQWNWYSNAWH